MKKFRMLLQKIREPYDEWIMHRSINKLANAIWKYALKDSLEPKYTKNDAYTLSIAIHWNNADEAKKVLSYTNEFGDRVFPK